MEADKAYSIPAEVLSAHLQDEAVLLHVGSKRYFRLNESGSWIWKGLERGLGREELLDHLCQRFEIDRATAGTALEEHLEQLCRMGLLLPVGSTDVGSTDVGGTDNDGEIDRTTL